MTAQRNGRVILRDKIVTQKEEMIQVEVTPRDAEDLIGLMYFIAGCPDGPRGAADRLRTAISQAGVFRMESGPRVLRRPSPGIYLEYEG